MNYIHQLLQFNGCALIVDLFEGTQVPEKCPVCDHDQGYFIRLEYAPFMK